MTAKDLVGAVVKNVFVHHELCTVRMELPSGQETILLVAAAPLSTGPGVQVSTQTGIALEGLRASSQVEPVGA